MTKSDTIRRRSNTTPGGRGFTLIEVLVTLVILSLSALGMASLQAVALRTNNDALLESLAATLAQDVIERIRANPTGDYTTTFDAANLIVNAPSCKGLAADCDAVAMVQDDLRDWKCYLGVVAMSTVCATRGIAGQLPGGDGTITVAGNTYTISIRWIDAANNATRPIIFTTVI